MLYWVLGSIGIMFILTCIIGVRFFYQLAFKKEAKDFLKKDPALNVTYTPAEYKRVVSQEKWWDAYPKKPLTIESKDGLRLHASLLLAPKQTEKFMILAHGYSSKGKDMAAYAQYYQETFGFNVLAPDARGHGKSDGTLFGMGWPDRLDYLAWINYLIERFGSEIEIALHGVSMGGATVMMLSGEKLPPQVKFIIEDSGYTSVYDLFKDQLWRKFKLPWFPLLSLVNLFARLKSGYSFKTASSLKQVEKATVPLLFIHSGDDLFVPTRMVEELYEVATVPKKKLVIKNAGHGSAFAVDNSGEIKAAISKYVTDYFE